MGGAKLPETGAPGNTQTRENKDPGHSNPGPPIPHHFRGGKDMSSSLIRALSTETTSEWIDQEAEYGCQADTEPSLLHRVLRITTYSVVLHCSAHNVPTLISCVQCRCSLKAVLDGDSAQSSTEITSAGAGAHGPLRSAEPVCVGNRHRGTGAFLIVICFSCIYCGA